MSVKVNLLPDEVGAKSKAGAQRSMLLAGFGVLVVLLGLGWWFNQGRVNDREVELAAAEAEVLALRGALAALEPFADLADRAAAAEGTLAIALGGEVSVAGVLQDVSSVFPPNAELEQLRVVLTSEVSPQPGGERVVYGAVEGIGELLLGVAPGAERLLIDLERAAAFDNVFVTVAVDEQDIGTFSFDLELGPEVLTRRYAAAEVAP